jgi:hypothetical protein
MRKTLFGPSFPLQTSGPEKTCKRVLGPLILSAENQRWFGRERNPFPDTFPPIQETIHFPPKPPHRQVGPLRQRVAGKHGWSTLTEQNKRHGMQMAIPVNHDHVLLGSFLHFQKLANKL